MILETLRLYLTERTCHQLANFHVFFWDRSDFGPGNGTVINYVEVVLKIYTDNGAAVNKNILYT